MQRNMFFQEKIETTLKRLKSFEPKEGYYLAFSGGKDSIVLKRLADMAGVKYDMHYSVTTIDPPELIQYIRKYHKDVIFERPKQPLLFELVKRGYPTRISRWCCAVYKETGGEGRFVLTGIRWAESYKRSKRVMVETCMKGKMKRFLHPIIDWSESEIWEFIKTQKLPYCKLYDEGWKRIGCLFCPNAYYKNRLREVERYPLFAKTFKIFFEKLYQDRKNKGSHAVDQFKNGEDMFNKWIGGKATKEKLTTPVDKEEGK
jgi:phosphoadenosine phosphosulfate reductase